MNIGTKQKNNMYSQNKEDEIIAAYYPSWYKGIVLDIGANDGWTFSNSRALIERGWKGVLIEPDPEAYKLLWERYKGSNGEVLCYRVAIGNHNDLETFLSAGTHLNKGDTGLLSSLKASNFDRFPGTINKSIQVEVSTFESFAENCPFKTFDAISLDAEEMDLDILRQINLKDTATSLVCVEFNGKDEHLYTLLMKEFGMSLIHKNTENLIYAIK